MYLRLTENQCQGRRPGPTGIIQLSFRLTAFRKFHWQGALQFAFLLLPTTPLCRKVWKSYLVLLIRAIFLPPLKSSNYNPPEVFPRADDVVPLYGAASFDNVVRNRKEDW